MRLPSIEPEKFLAASGMPCSDGVHRRIDACIRILGNDHGFTLVPPQLDYPGLYVVGLVGNDYPRLDVSGQGTRPLCNIVERLNH